MAASGMNYCVARLATGGIVSCWLKARFDDDGTLVEQRVERGTLDGQAIDRAELDRLLAQAVPPLPRHRTLVRTTLPG